MNTPIKISEAASLALHTMVMLAVYPQTTMTAREISANLGVSEAHLAKVLQRLGRAGLVASQRGPRGGFTLARPSQDITLLDVYQAVEGPLQTTSCLLGRPVCGGRCILGGLLDKIGQEVRDYFAGTRLSELTNAFICGERHAQG